MTNQTIEHYLALAADPATPPAKLRSALRHAATELQKRRQRQGKLTDEDIAEIITRYNKGEKQATLADEYGVKQPTVHRHLFPDPKPRRIA